MSEYLDLKQSWMIGSGLQPTPYNKHDRGFLEDVIARYPWVGINFATFEAMPRAARPDEAVRIAALTRRQVWAGFGIPDYERETLAEHTGAMIAIALRFPQKKIDMGELVHKLTLWQAPLVIAGEIPLHHMDLPDRRRLRGLALDSLWDYHQGEKIRRDRALYEELDHDTTVTDRFARDLCYMATARRALEYARDSHCPQAKCRLAYECHGAVQTDQARLIWNDAVGANPQRQPLTAPERTPIPA